MIKSIKNLDGINDFQLCNSHIVSLEGESILNRNVNIFDINFEGKNLVENEIIPSFTVKEDTVFVYTKGKTLIFKINTNISVKNECIGFYPYLMLNDTFLGNFTNEDEQNFLQCRSPNGIELYWSLDYTSTIRYFYKYLFVVKFGGNLTKLQLFALGINTGEALWQYTIPTHYTYTRRFEDKISQEEISRIIGVYDDVIWIVLDTGRLMGLSIEDGALQYEMVKPNNYTEEPFYRAYANDIFIGGVRTQLDESKGIMFGLWKTFYWEIDLANPTTSTYMLYDLTETFQQWNISADMANGYEWAWEKDEIFFGEIYDAERRGSTSNTVGIFDRNKKEVIGADRIGKKGETAPMIQKIDYAAGRLYVLDGEGTLHIFER